MLRADLLSILRSVEMLKGVDLVYPNEIQAQIAPHLVTLRGVVYLNGEPKVYESELNLLDFKSRDDGERLVKLLLTSFDKASR